MLWCHFIVLACLRKKCSHTFFIPGKGPQSHSIPHKHSTYLWWAEKCGGREKEFDGALFWELFIFHPLRTLLNLIENYSWADFLLLDTLFWWWKSVDGWTMVSVHLVLLEKWSGLLKYGSWSSMLSDFSAFSTSNLFSWASILCFSSLLPFLPATLMWKSWKNSLCS